MYYIKQGIYKHLIDAGGNLKDTDIRSNDDDDEIQIYDDVGRRDTLKTIGRKPIEPYERFKEYKDYNPTKISKIKLFNNGSLEFLLTKITNTSSNNEVNTIIQIINNLTDTPPTEGTNKYYLVSSSDLKTPIKDIDAINITNGEKTKIAEDREQGFSNVYTLEKESYTIVKRICPPEDKNCN